MFFSFLLGCLSLSPSLCYRRHLCSVTHSSILHVLTVQTKLFFPTILSSSDTQVWIFAWLLDILSWMSAHSFKLITSDNNIANSAQTVKHLTVIPARKLSYEALSAATKPCWYFALKTLVIFEYSLNKDTDYLVWSLIISCLQLLPRGT